MQQTNQEHPTTAGKSRVSVTLEQSAKINARIGELGPTVPSGHELTAQINQEFGLNWGEHAIWRRARKAGHYWPGGTEPRLTPERSRQVDARLRERIEAGMPGTEIVKTINGEIGQALTLPAYFARAQRLNLQWPPTPKAGRPWSGTESFPQDQWQACYDDPVYEARNQIRDRLVCRECLRKALLNPTLHVALYCDGAMEGEHGHLRRIHGIGKKDYRLLHPGAPINTWDRIAKESGRDVYQVMASRVDKYATPEERAVAQNDPRYDKDKPYVICRVPRCGFKSTALLGKHLSQAHGMDAEKIAEHRHEYKWPPITTQHYSEARAARNRERTAELQRRALPVIEDEKKLNLAALLKADQLAGGHMSNDEAQAQAGTEYSKRTMTRLRREIGVRGPTGRAGKNL
jgi:hypothetical protein